MAKALNGPADTVRAADLIQRLDQLRRRHRFAVHRHRNARLERDRDLLRGVGSVHRIGGELEHRRLRLERRVFERTAFVRKMPQIAVARIRVLLRHRHGNPALGGVVDRVFAGDDVPFAPGRDDLQLGREGLVGELEPHLVVPFSGAAVRQRVASGLQCDLDLFSRDERPRRRRSTPAT